MKDPGFSFWRKWRPFVMAIPIGAMVLGIAAWMSKKQAMSESIEQTQVIIQEGFDLDEANVLRYYLRINEGSDSDWIAQNKGLVSLTPESGIDIDNNPIALSQSLDVIVSGSLQVGSRVRRAFLIQYASIQVGADLPVSDTYSCEILVGTHGSDGWKLENMDVVEESQYEGGTRWAKDCSGFKLSWRDGYPEFARTVTYGPYAGGAYSNVLKVVRRNEGKYEMTSDEIDEPGLD